ncbi:uncharacterized protein LOC112689883 isoform X2 [Sipha flava]|uniref:Uncharacterized protein LOC112689883 isoform X2 n=1 Tax=Sipha flava TaxID=143950 RepID=A0A8B8G9I9_9HEMI|nr:uncharacterized protein LOC112689883 isoform X2 [Sipha flava]
MKEENPNSRFSYNKKKLKSRRGSNNDLAKKPVKSIDLDKIDASLKSIRSAIAHTKITQEKLCINCTNEKYLDFKNQGTQTINPYNEEDVLKDSIVRYPKSEKLDTATIQMNHKNTAAVQTERSESDCSNYVSKNSLKPLKKDEINLKTKHSVGFKENATSYHQPGEIPKYLKDRKVLKEKNEKETQKKLAIRRELGLDDPACPPGHLLLPEPERLEHLSKIKKDYNHLLTQLNMLPVSSDSYKMKEKRKNLENELDKLQLGIKLFSRKKLYVKMSPKN